MTKTGNAIFYSVLLAFQFGLQPMLASWYTHPSINKSLIVVATEASKIFIAFFSILFFNSKEEFRTIIKEWTLVESLRVAALPAILYAIQNVLIQHGYLYLNSLTFNLLNQTKTLSAALWLYILMGQRQSYMQMFALFLISIAAVILNLNPNETLTIDETVNQPQNHLGVILVLIASMLSGVSAALTQKVLAGSGKQRNSFLLSAELALYGIIFLSMKELLQSLSTQEESIFLSPISLFDNWSTTTWIPVLTNASGGLVVGLVTKYAGGVVKGFALIAGLVLTGVVQWIVAGIPLGIYDWIAAILVSISIILHTQFPPSSTPSLSPTKPTKGKKE